MLAGGRCFMADGGVTGGRWSLSHGRWRGDWWPVGGLVAGVVCWWPVAGVWWPVVSREF
ncbi:hypothetical protein NG798_24765 [Ancylothrix sp. C2]|uniref:hypothetical protein n=1 Tax=Ancylothrix sp. D3o TaxID=2953691 RepID=UPI0021BBA1DA|nr:hypothetical protein [Ancylothrix sp. D3o]MCT7953015.1 hypothetical protein [Ancylothrix sp. D3o]